MRMKADILGNINPMIDFTQEEAEFFGDFDVGGFIDAFEPNGNGNGKAGNGKLDYSLALTPKRVPKRKVTAVELISAIQSVMEDKVAKQNWTKTLKRKTVAYAKVPDIRNIIKQVYERITELLAGRDHVMFSDLVSNREQIVETFVGILPPDIEQEVFWQIILIQKLLFDLIVRMKPRFNSAPYHLNTFWGNFEQPHNVAFCML